MHHIEAQKAYLMQKNMIRLINEFKAVKSKRFGLYYLILEGIQEAMSPMDSGINSMLTSFMRTCLKGPVRTYYGLWIYPE